MDIGDGGGAVVLDTTGLQRLLNALRALGIGAEHFPWPPPGDPQRAPYRGWAPLDEADAAVFFGRDAQILRGLDVLRGMRSSGVESLFVILGPSGTGKSSFLRAGLLPRLRRDDRRFALLPVIRPERAVLTGEHGLAAAIDGLRAHFGIYQPLLGDIKEACNRGLAEQLRVWVDEVRAAARARLLDAPADQPDGADDGVGRGVDQRQVRLALLVIWAMLPSGLIAAAYGYRPTVTVAMVVFVAVSMTDTVSTPRLGT